VFQDPWDVLLEQSLSLVWQFLATEFAEALFITGAAWATIEMVPIDTAIKCDGDSIPLIYIPAGRTISTVILIQLLG
jgi:hypothetical protein